MHCHRFPATTFSQKRTPVQCTAVLPPSFIFISHFIHFLNCTWNFSKTWCILCCYQSSLDESTFYFSLICTFNLTCFTLGLAGTPSISVNFHSHKLFLEMDRTLNRKVYKLEIIIRVQSRGTSVALSLLSWPNLERWIVV